MIYDIFAFFDWKIGVFQQTVVSVYYILKVAALNCVDLVN